MKLLLSILFIIAVNLCNAQNVVEKNGTVSFPTIADYDYFADNPDNRGAIDVMVTNSGSITTLSTLATEAVPEEVPDFLKQILNTDYIVSIGSFYVKIDFINQRALVIAAATPGAYNDLVTNNLTATGMIQFTMDDGNALEVMENIENGSASVANYKDLIVKHTEEMNVTTSFISGPSYNFNEKEIFACPNPKVDPKRVHLAWGPQRPSGDCTAPLNNMATLSGDLKLVYQKAVIYFSLQSKEKCRLVCVYGGDPPTAGTVSVYMYLSGTVRYKRCGWSERSSNHTSNFTWTNEKSWRPFESSRRLEKLDFTVQFKQAENLGVPHTFPIMNLKVGY